VISEQLSVEPRRATDVLREPQARLGLTGISRPEARFSGRKIPAAFAGNYPHLAHNGFMLAVPLKYQPTNPSTINAGPNRQEKTNTPHPPPSQPQ